MLNTVVLMGRLTSDPELRHTPSDISVTSFTLAVERSYVKSGTDRQVDFIDIVAWRTNAEFVCKYFRKGQLVAVQGSIQTRIYQDKNGNNRKAFEIIADNVYFAEPKRDNSFSSNQNSFQNKGFDSVDNNEFQDNSSYSSGNIDDFEEVPMDDDLPF